MFERVGMPMLTFISKHGRVHIEPPRAAGMAVDSFLPSFNGYILAAESIQDSAETAQHYHPTGVVSWFLHLMNLSLRFTLLLALILASTSTSEKLSGF